MSELLHFSHFGDIFCDSSSAILRRIQSVVRSATGSWNFDLAVDVKKTSCSPSHLGHLNVFKLFILCFFVLNFLGDRSKVLMVVHVSPYEEDVGETTCSCTFAKRARAAECNRELSEVIPSFFFFFPIDWRHCDFSLFIVLHLFRIQRSKGKRGLLSLWSK